MKFSKLRAFGGYSKVRVEKKSSTSKKVFSREDY